VELWWRQAVGGEAGSRRRPSNRGRKRRWEAVRICGDGVDEAVVEW
jgi:hypothetical protein